MQLGKVRFSCHFKNFRRISQDGLYPQGYQAKQHHGPEQWNDQINRHGHGQNQRPQYTLKLYIHPIV